MAFACGLKRVVACGISGGVDSAVAAALLKRKGFEVLGTFMKNWDDQDEEGTCQRRLEEDYNDAKSTCDHLRIPFVEVSFVKEYWNQVFSELLDDYEQGFTPNPDVLCNRYIKFGSFFRYARSQLGADAIATGHYAQNSFGPFLENYSPSSVTDLRRAVDSTKDQTLFLSSICQEPLRRTMFPLGQLYKHQVRRIAKEYGMEKISKKKDSVGICFVGDRKFPTFISKYLEDKPGVIVCQDTGKIIGEHNGVHHWTLGQRCRISRGNRYAYYVCHMEPKTQTVYAVMGRDHPALYSRYITVAFPHWISHQYDLYPDKPFHCMFKFQHKEWTIPCQMTVDKESNHVNLYLSIATRAITPGQQAVFYKGNVCLGSAKILSSDALGGTDKSKMEKIVSVASQQSNKM